MATKVIKVDMLARVEGEGALHIKIRDREVAEVKLNIFEPPRFFEAFLRGRHYSEVPDITARICGICPIAYQMSSVQAMENAFGAEIPSAIRQLRRLIYCGEWIESHALHIYFLHAPDFLGYEDAIALAKDHPDAVKRALRLKKIGNDLMILLGGREIHPINVRVGGFYRAPLRSELQPLVEDLKWARDAALETVRFTATLNFPDFEPDYEFVALSHPTDYPITEGRIVSSRGLDIDVSEYEQHFVEEHVPHSNALHSHLKARGAYLVGPLARYALNFSKLSPLAQQAARDAKLKPICRNPFKSIIVRAVETVYACEEALRLIAAYEPPEKASVPLAVRAASGQGCTEAPRGILYHRYRVDAQGIIRDAKIVPPTSQNQPSIEDDLRQLVTRNVDLPADKLQWLCEQSVRNYDPCISCATHFLKLTLDRA
jgi:coenzyme F420-reducing hydrogenase alpha subunit